MNATQLKYWEEQCGIAYHNAAFNYVKSVEQKHVLKNLSEEVKNVIRHDLEEKLKSDTASLIINYYDSGSVYIGQREVCIKVPANDRDAKEDSIRKELNLLMQERDAMIDIVYSHPNEQQLEVVKNYIKMNERHIGCA